MATPRGAGIILTALFLAATSAVAQPTLNHLYPAAGQIGTTNTITAVGKFDPWPPRVWVDAPGIIFKPSASTGKFDVEIAKDAAPGPHLVRFFNDRGASALRFFIVSAEPELRETEPNDDFSRAQRIEKFPATISGRLDKSGDVDSFAVTLKRGQPLVAWLEAYVLASTFDGLLRIVDPNGVQLAFNHDGRTLDPMLKWQAPHDGTFVVQVMGFVYPATADVRLAGSDTCVYRLHLAEQAPKPDASMPPTGFKIISEKEPNDTALDAQSLTLPGTVNGNIARSGDEDRFAFAAKKKAVYEITIIAARLGSSLDAWLKIENADGKELARSDDSGGSRDPKLTWTASGDGTFIAALGDVTHHGGDNFFYRLEINETAPEVTATVANHFFSVQPGKTNEAKVTVKRLNGFQTKLQLVAKVLPSGVTASGGEVPDKDDEATLKLSATTDAPPANEPLQFVLREAGSGVEHPVTYSLISTGENNGVPQGYSELVINSTDQLWLTVSAEPPKPEKKKKK